MMSTASTTTKRATLLPLATTMKKAMTTKSKPCSSPFTVVLHEPQIPQNTGNIARTCAATGSALLLVEPLGFQISDRWLKRSGLDYWHLLESRVVPNFDTFIAEKQPFYLFSSKGKRSYSDAHYSPGSALIFGSETSGLPAAILEEWEECVYRIPMVDNARCLNLATAAGIVLYEALRQNHFLEMVLV